MVWLVTETEFVVQGTAFSRVCMMDSDLEVAIARARGNIGRRHAAASRWGESPEKRLIVMVAWCITPLCSAANSALRFGWPMRCARWQLGDEHLPRTAIGRPLPFPSLNLIFHTQTSEFHTASPKIPKLVLRLITSVCED